MKATNEIHQIAFEGVVDLFDTLDQKGLAGEENIIGVLTGALQAVVSATYGCAPDVESAEMLIEIAIEEVRKHERRVH